MLTDPWGEGRDEKIFPRVPLNEENFRELLSRLNPQRVVMPQEVESKGYKFCFSRVLFIVT